ncbi:MAG: IS1634 family transposase [Kiritimatiellae bacterium]|nr:IS1634 family transposase [Kiritimatiellia bacterium]
MHIELFTVRNRPYLRLVESRRRMSRNGKPISGKRLVLSLGPLAKHDDGKPGYLDRLRQSFREGRPLIEALGPYVGDAPREEWDIKFRDGDDGCNGEPKRLAACVLDPVFSALGLDQLFASVKHASKIRYDLQGLVRLLVYGRILEPASKCATMEQNGTYHEPLVSSDNPDNVYDALTVIDENAEKVFRRMNTCIKRGIGRNPSLVFYDVTNFYFEIAEADEDVLDESGNVVKKGLSKFGVSKENRKQPIVQIGLFMDDNGIPVSFEMFPGNTLDHHTLRPAMERTVDGFGLGRFVLVADRGMYSAPNMCHVTDAGNGYIVSKSLRKSTAATRRWAVSPEGCTVVSDRFRRKSRIVRREVTLVKKDKDGKETRERRRFTEKEVVYWSEAFYRREMHEHKSFLDFVERLRANPAGFRVSAAQSKSLRKFLKDEYLNKKTNEVVDGRKLVAMIDEDKLNEFNELMGYYMIATSELDTPDQEIIDKYHGLTQIEDQFREMKGTLEARPVFVNTPGHVHAHLLVCFIALTMMRLVQRRIAMAEPRPDAGGDLKWSYGMSGERLSKALREWQVLRHPGELYQMLNSSGEDIRHILSALGADVGKRIYTRGGIAALKSSVKVF